MVVFGQKGFLFRQSGLFAKRCCIRAKVVIFGQNWLCSGKLVVFGQNGCNPVKWLFWGKRGCLRAKVAVFGQRWLYSGKLVVFGETWLYSGKSGSVRAIDVVFRKSCCIRKKKWF